MAHTTGHWKQIDWHKIKHMPEGSAQCIVANGKIIAILEWDCTGLRGVNGDYSHFVTLDERNANARLIAAAPELLETLKQVEWTWAVDGGLVCPWCGARSYDGHLAECPRQLTIAKAEATL